ncbi:MAG: FecR family protein [Rhodanobacteraceae bacterium]
MTRYLLILIVALFSSIAIPAIADEDHAALVKSTTGTVKVTRQQHLFDATSGTTLQVSDRIVTAPDSSAAIVFRDGTLLTLGSGADVLVRDYVFQPKAGEYSFSLYLARGSAIYESGKIGKVAPQSVKVETPTATVGVRGTRFLIDAN